MREPRVVRVLIPLALLAILTEYFAYGMPNGAPMQACSTLIPQHPDTSPQECGNNSCDSLFQLSFFLIDPEPVALGNTYRCGSNHTVVLGGNAQNTFRGFFVQSRVPTSLFNSSAPFLGEFLPSSATQTRNCGGYVGGGITHTENADKTSVQLTWVAPPPNEAPQPVTFWFSIVVQSRVYYIHLSKTLIPDERFCILQQPDTRVMFSLPSEPLSVQESDSNVGICVTKTGQTEKTFEVTVFTRVVEQGADTNRDYMDTSVRLLFAPEDSKKCVNISILTDSVTERPEIFEVVAELNFQDSAAAIISPSTVIVVIIDGSYVGCNASEFECSVEAFCLPQSFICDGIEDCLFSDDELQCDTSEPCDHREIRVRGGSTQSEGLVEACNKGSFATACLNGVDVVDSVVVCRALGFSGAGVWVNALREFGVVGSGPVQASRLDCIGNETHPFECAANQDNDDCSHANDAGIRCLDPVCEHGSVRLVNGSGVESTEGKVQVCFQGLWGTVISRSWGFKEARVVCRSLGREEYGALPIPRFFYSNRNDVIIATSARCNGFEGSLLDCVLNYKNGEMNDDDYLVGVRCDDLPATGCSDGEVRLVARESEASGQVEVCLNNRWGRVCSSDWDLNEATVVCRQLNHTANSSESNSAVRNALGNQSTPITLDNLGCRGEERNLLECPIIEENRRKRQQQTCPTQLEAGVRCAESPRILLSPPSENGSYVVALGSDTEIRCILEPNLYPRPFNFTSYRVDGKEVTLIDSGGDEVDVVDGVFSGVGAEVTQVYLCRAENGVGLANQFVNISVTVLSGPRSRAYLRFSLPRLEDRLILIVESVDILPAIESFILTEINNRDFPGQQLVRCTTSNRTMTDLERKRDRYECVIDIYPPLDGDPTAVAQFVKKYLNAQTVSFSEFRISVLGFCDSEPSEYGIMWPETEADNTVRIPCNGGMAIRMCSPDAQWLVPDVTQCIREGCNASEFECSVETFCLPQSYICDGIEDCLFSDDELQCDTSEPCDHREIRVRGGSTQSEGLVEACNEGSFATACLNGVDVVDSVVVCRALGFSGAGVWVNALREFGVVGSGPVQASRLDCIGNETHPFECAANQDNDDCSHANDAGIRCLDPVCEHGSVRLVNGSGVESTEGKVQVCFQGLWGTVISRSWGFKEARVVCRSLGREEYGALPIPRFFYSNRNDVIIATSARCNGFEGSLLDCVLNYRNVEMNDDDYLVGVRCDDLPATGCSDGEVRLVARESEASGQVEVCLNNRWGRVCSSDWDLNEATVVCRQLNHTANSSESNSAVRNALGNQSTPITLDNLGCRGEERNLLECPIIEENRRKRQQQTCPTQLEAGVRCAESPRILLSPPSENGSYVIALGSDTEIRCILEPNLYPRPFNFTSYRVDGKEMTLIDSGGDEVDVVDGVFSGVGAEVTQVYLCRAENGVGLANQFVNISVTVLSGPRSRAYLRFSLPRLEDRLILIVESVDILPAIESFILTEINRKFPGQQLVRCTTSNRTMTDLERKRDRYECVIDIYPPLDGNPTAVAQFVKKYLNAQTVSFSEFRISVLGFCDSEPSEYGIMWPETEADNTVRIPCDGGMAIRVCSPDAKWLVPDVTKCIREGPTEPEMFCCDSEDLCITQDNMCDGIAHCLLAEDESRCPPVVTNCTNGEIRLSLGLSNNEGIVEFCVDGAFGDLCGDRFTADNAKVVCRQLGLPEGAVPLRDNIQSLLQTHPISLSCDGSETRLSECEREDYSSSTFSSCVFNPAAVRCQVQVDCQDGDLRLVGGRNEQEGNLQVCINGVWGSVSQRRRRFNFTEASVACNQLGYNPTGALALPSGYFHPDSGVTPFISDVTCSGTEILLSECSTRHDGDGNGFENDNSTNGDGDNDDDFHPVAIRCDDYPKQNCENGSIRLLNREYPGRGIVELCLNNEWSILCRNALPTPNEASVVCRQLGFIPEESFSTVETVLEPAGGKFYLGSFTCGGNESSLLECDFSNGDSLREKRLNLCIEGTVVVCSTSPNPLLNPPPIGSDNTYVVEVGHRLQVQCSAANTFPQSRVIGVRVGSGETSDACTSSQTADSEIQILDYQNGVPPSVAGDYQCIACNNISTVTENFTVVVQSPEREGSSSFLRVSIPVIERLSLLLENEPDVLSAIVLDALEAEIISREVIENEDGIQTIQCLNAGKTPADLDARRDRYECKISTFPPTDGIMQLVERVAIEMQRSNVVFSAITTSETGFCGYEVDETAWGTYIWPETKGGNSAILTCQLDDTVEVTRHCRNGGGWDTADYEDCILRQLEDITRENLGETSEAVAAAVQEAEQTESNSLIVRNAVLTTAAFALQDPLIVDEEIVSSVVDIINGLQEWPDDVIQANDTGAQIVRSFEVIVLGLAQQENFTELTVVNENVAIRIERVDLSDITTGRSLAVSEGNGSLNAALGSESGLAADQIASGFLPLSLFNMISNRGDMVTVPIVFAVLRTGSLFSVDEGQESTSGLVTSVGSPVVSLTVGVNEAFTNLPDPVIVNVRILVQNFTNPRCVSYDFNQQAWVTDGCTTILTSDRNQITCECNHLTNFASLVDICSRTEEGGCDQSDEAKLALSIISIIGVILSGVGLILTIVTLLIFPKLRSRDASKFHVQLSLALLGMLLVFVVGIDRTEVFEGCVTVSVLIHYFTLVAVMWMGAEAVLIFRKLVIVFVHITTRFIIIISLICWLVPIVPALIPAIIDPHFMITNTDSNNFCFIGDVRVFFGAFLGPIFAILLFNVVIFILVIGVLVKHNRNKAGKTADIKSQKKSNVRLAISLFGIMILFGLTWVLGAFTIREASLAFQILFAVFNSLQGFFVFIFFCVLSPDVRQLWLKTVTCGRYDMSSYSAGSKGYSTTRQHRFGANKSHKTVSSGLSSQAHYASNSAIELSENPSSTVLDSVSTMEERPTPNAPPPHVYQPPTTSHAHVFQNYSAMEERAGGAITQSGNDMEMSVTFN